MICPECKVANADDHNYCKHCGFPLRAHAVGRDLRMGSAEHARDRCLLIVKHNPDSPEAYFTSAWPITIRASEAELLELAR
jgi:hypothetical protein